jgi:hypothetical protein
MGLLYFLQFWQLAAAWKIDWGWKRSFRLHPERLWLTDDFFRGVRRSGRGANSKLHLMLRLKRWTLCPLCLHGHITVRPFVEQTRIFGSKKNVQWNSAFMRRANRCMYTRTALTGLLCEQFSVIHCCFSRRTWHFRPSTSVWACVWCCVYLCLFPTGSIRKYALCVCVCVCVCMCGGEGEGEVSSSQFSAIWHGM